MKTQKPLTLLMLLTTLALFSACEKLDEGMGITGQGPMQEVTHQTTDFRNIEVDVDANVFLTQGDAQPVVIRGQRNILDVIEVAVTGQTLKINYLAAVCSHEKPEIFICLPSLENLSTARGASIHSKNAFGSNQMVFQIYGSGNISMQVKNASTVCSHVRGTGKITLAGEAEKLEVVINGSGTVTTFDLITHQSVVSITGSGKCEVFGGDELTVNINGSGQVFYRGNPATLNKSLSGSGELHRME